MPRPHRLRIPGLPQHVMQRGTGRIDMFRAAADYEVFRATLHDAAMRTRVEIHAYVLMTNHIHLVVTSATLNGVSVLMQSVGRRYVKYFNERYDRAGALFEGRYRSAIIDSEQYCLTCIRYVELNPVRAGMVAQPQDYRWSSHQMLGLGLPDSLITPHYLYLALGDTAEQRQRCWREICQQPLPEAELRYIRQTVHYGRALGPIVLPGAA